MSCGISSREYFRSKYPTLLTQGLLVILNRTLFPSLSVLREEMSLVGPRPPIAAKVEQYQLAHLRRLDVLPGMTGLWQVEAPQDWPRRRGKNACGNTVIFHIQERAFD
jgi:hypothetical protein